MGKLRREYLNHEEKNFWFIAKAFIQTIEGQRNLDNKVTKEVWEEWNKRGMMTPSMVKNLKLVRTYLKKFCYELEENLSATEQTRLNKQVEKFDYKLVDDYTVKKLMRDINNHMKYAVIERENFENILETIAAVKCCGCTECYEKCDLYKTIDDIGIPYLGEEPNCPYACNLDKLNEKELKGIEEIKKNLRYKNQIARKVI